MAQVALILFIALCWAYGGAAMECRASTPLGSIPFNCPRNYAPFNDKDDLFCCGRESDIGGQRCCNALEFGQTNTGLIIGVVVGVVILLLIITLFICCCCSCCCLYKRRHPGTVYAQAPQKI